MISTHTPLAGRDNVLRVDVQSPPISTHTPLAGRDDSKILQLDGIKKFQLTRPLRGATPEVEETEQPADISTHTPLAGRDFIFWANVERIAHFNSHAPCGARRLQSG